LRGNLVAALELDGGRDDGAPCDGDGGGGPNAKRVRKAYRKLALRYHPDKLAAATAEGGGGGGGARARAKAAALLAAGGGGDALGGGGTFGARELFPIVQQAYETLTDAAKRGVRYQPEASWATWRRARAARYKTDDASGGGGGGGGTATTAKRSPPPPAAAPRESATGAAAGGGGGGRAAPAAAGGAGAAPSASSFTSEPAPSASAVRAMRVPQLKARLRDLGVAHADAVEREELVERLLEVR